MRAFPVAFLSGFLALTVGETSSFAQDEDACIAASENAVSLRKADKLIEARAALSTCAASSCPDAVRSSCQQRLGDISRAIPSIVFLARDGGGHDLSAVRLIIDGKPYASHLDGAAIVLDTGDHEFQFEVDGQPPLVKHFVLHQGEQNRREEIVIHMPGEQPSPSPKATLPLITDAVASPLLVPSIAPTLPSQPHGNAARTSGFVVGSVGLAGLAVGGLFGALSMSAHNSYEQHCASIGAPPGKCDATGVKEQNDATMKGNVSTAAFIGGGIATAAGAVILLALPGDAHHTEVGLGPSGLWWTGRF